MPLEFSSFKRSASLPCKSPIQLTDYGFGLTPSLNPLCNKCDCIIMRAGCNLAYTVSYRYFRCSCAMHSDFSFSQESKAYAFFRVGGIGVVLAGLCI